jgi:hypothetical protein
LKIITRLALCATLCAPVAAAPAWAANGAYLGDWKIVRAMPAPWADVVRPGDAAERARLIGKTVTFKAHAITGPQPFACRGPHYKFSEFTADMLFEGSFGEMQSRNKAVDPNKIAASLGFVGPQVRTLETGCEFDFHFVDANTTEVGLNDEVYVLKKQ